MMQFILSYCISIRSHCACILFYIALMLSPIAYFKGKNSITKGFGGSVSSLRYFHMNLQSDKDKKGNQWSQRSLRQDTTFMIPPLSYLIYNMFNCSTVGASAAGITHKWHHRQLCNILIIINLHLIFR